MKLVNSRMIWVKDQLDLPDRLESQETTDLKEILAPVDPKEMLDHQELRSTWRPGTTRTTRTTRTRRRWWWQPILKRS